MKSTKQKTLHEIGGRTLLGHALHAAAEINPERIVTVVGHQRDQVAPAVDAIAQELGCEVLQAVQEEQLGTGHAVACGLEPIPDFEGTVIVTNGDVPLLTPETIEGLRATHTEQGNAVTVLSMRLDDPTGYGRIIRAEDSSVSAIVEQKDATEEQRQSMRSIPAFSPLMGACLPMPSRSSTPITPKASCISPMCLKLPVPRGTASART